MTSGPGSRRTAATERTLIARPSSDRSLSDGVVIEASVVARLLGLKLLRVRAQVTVLPAEPARRLPRFPSEFPSEPAPPSLDGGRLADAAQLLAHACRTLDDAKRNGL